MVVPCVPVMSTAVYTLCSHNIKYYVDCVHLVLAEFFEQNFDLSRFTRILYSLRL